MLSILVDLSQHQILSQHQSRPKATNDLRKQSMKTCCNKAVRLQPLSFRKEQMLNLLLLLLEQTRQHSNDCLSFFLFFLLQCKGGKNSSLAAIFLIVTPFQLSHFSCKRQFSFSRQFSTRNWQLNMTMQTRGSRSIKLKRNCELRSNWFRQSMVNIFYFGFSGCILIR